MARGPGQHTRFFDPDDELRERVEDLETENGELRGRVDALEKDHKELKKDNKELKKDNKELKKNVNILLEERNEKIAARILGEVCFAIDKHIAALCKKKGTKIYSQSFSIISSKSHSFQEKPFTTLWQPLEVLLL
jgi:dsDNA-specific endonuclease/ATPase MutS2